MRRKGPGTVAEARPRFLGRTAQGGCPHVILAALLAEFLEEQAD